jgi:Nose resistant-to-fluoxetine protein, N-terminal domain
MLKVFIFCAFSILGVFGQNSVINDAVCDRQLSYFDDELNNREHWAVFVFDTWAKLQSSVFRGNLVVPGGFTDCVNFRHNSNSTTIGTFQGQHCMVNFRPTEIPSDINREGGFDWKEV